MFLNPGEAAPVVQRIGMRWVLWSILHRPALVASALLTNAGRHGKCSTMHDVRAQA
jgi:hypothetical protein